jgi:hypothetical protein
MGICKAFAASDKPYFQELYKAVGSNILVLEVFAKNLGKFNNGLKMRYSREVLTKDLGKGLLELGKAELAEVR